MEMARIGMNPDLRQILEKIQMRIGIKFPTREIGSDRGAIRDWAIKAGELGFAHVVLIDHVLGVDPDAHPGYDAQFPSEGKRAPYKISDQFHEPLMLLAFITALSPNIELSTGVIVSPQRQTALLAKQIAELDVLSGGNTRLCIGIGWNPVEYESLHVDFRTRGKRIEAQVAALRALWAQESVDIDNEYEHFVGVGLAPNAVQRALPIWLGGWSPKVMERIGRIADGWYYGHDRPPHLADDLDIIRRSAETAGRDPATIGLEGAVELRDGLEGIDQRVAEWEKVGATHVVIDPMMGGYSGADHVKALDEIAARISL
jgi:probable F420-dependent oxidoreductase